MADETVAAPAAADDASRTHHEWFERWFREAFHGTVVAQHTHVLNHVRQKFDELKGLVAPR